MARPKRVTQIGKPVPATGLFSPLASQCQTAVTQLEQARDNGEAVQALKTLHSLVVPWLKALRPTEPVE